nr:hypothetical transcript [Hymenolepis microstoma]
MRNETKKGSKLPKSQHQLTQSLIELTRQLDPELAQHYEYCEKMSGNEWPPVRKPHPLPNKFTTQSRIPIRSPSKRINTPKTGPKSSTKPVAELETKSKIIKNLEPKGNLEDTRVMNHKAEKLDPNLKDSKSKSESESVEEPEEKPTILEELKSKSVQESVPEDGFLTSKELGDEQKSELIQEIPSNSNINLSEVPGIDNKKLMEYFHCFLQQVNPEISSRFKTCEALTAEEHLDLIQKLESHSNQEKPEENSSPSSKETIQSSEANLSLKTIPATKIETTAKPFVTESHNETINEIEPSPTPEYLPIPDELKSIIATLKSQLVLKSMPITNTGDKPGNNLATVKEDRPKSTESESNRTQTLEEKLNSCSKVVSGQPRLHMSDPRTRSTIVSEIVAKPALVNPAVNSKCDFTTKKYPATKSETKLNSITVRKPEFRATPPEKSSKQEEEAHATPTTAITKASTSPTTLPMSPSEQNPQVETPEANVANASDDVFRPRNSHGKKTEITNNLRMKTSNAESNTNVQFISESANQLASNSCPSGQQKGGYISKSDFKPDARSEQLETQPRPGRSTIRWKDLDLGMQSKMKAFIAEKMQDDMKPFQRVMQQLEKNKVRDSDSKSASTLTSELKCERGRSLERKQENGSYPVPASNSVAKSEQTILCNSKTLPKPEMKSDVKPELTSTDRMKSLQQLLMKCSPNFVKCIEKSHEYTSSGIQKSIPRPQLSSTSKLIVNPTTEVKAQPEQDTKLDVLPCSNQKDLLNSFQSHLEKFDPEMARSFGNYKNKLDSISEPLRMSGLSANSSKNLLKICQLLLVKFEEGLNKAGEIEQKIMRPNNPSPPLLKSSADFNHEDMVRCLHPSLNKLDSEIDKSFNQSEQFQSESESNLKPPRNSNCEHQELIKSFRLFLQNFEPKTAKTFNMVV